MADFTKIEKLKLEQLFGMGSGYVLDFSNRTFYEFILDSTGLDIYDEKYNYSSGSKANRLRAFWEKESNEVVVKLLGVLLEEYYPYYKTTRNWDQATENRENNIYNECLNILKKLRQSRITGNINSIQPNSDDKDFSLLARSIRESIEKNEPGAALDRLHTFITRYIRELCDKFIIPYKKDMALHSLFGSYIKYLRENGMIESEMTERILRSFISILEAFNEVRNNSSYAHDNPILNHNESLLILNSISNLVHFLESIMPKQNTPNTLCEKKEEKLLNNSNRPAAQNDDDIPF